MCLNHGSSTLRLKAWMSASLGWYSRSVRTAPAGPEDVVGRSLGRIECHIEKFLAPLEPGNLLLFG
jgi:hypothetical protein